MTYLCIRGGTGAGAKGVRVKRPQKHEQRLLTNMGAHAVVLDLLQIPYEKVHCHGLPHPAPPLPVLPLLARPAPLSQSYPTPPYPPAITLGIMCYISTTR